MYIKTENVQNRILLLNILLKMGYKWHGEAKWTGEKINAQYKRSTYPTINVDDGYMYGNCQTATYTFPKDSYEIMDALVGDPKYVEVKNVGDYTAKVYADKIEVGCQTISLEVFDELASAVVTQRED